MSPRKSVSGIIGICKGKTEDFKASACSFCENRCEYYRKEQIEEYYARQHIENQVSIQPTFSC